jgi:GATA-binding protein
MSDQAAAEALVAVGRGGGGGGDDSDGDGQDQVSAQPRRKRARRSGKGADKEPQGMRGTEEDEDDAMDTGDRRVKRSSRDPAGIWGDAPASPPRLDQQRVPEGYAALPRGHGHFSGSPHPHPTSHEGFNLPPLNAALSERERAFGAFGGVGMGHFSGVPSSYLRSGSNAPSRTHSPMGPGSAAAPTAVVNAATGYALPPPHGHYYSGIHGTPGPQPYDFGMMGMGVMSPLPTLADLDRYCHDLHESRRWLEDTLERTDRLLIGLKRGMEELRTGTTGAVGNVSAHEGGAGGAGAGANADALPRTSPGEKERRESVWPIEHDSGNR